MATTIAVPIQFIDAGNSAKKYLDDLKREASNIKPGTSLAKSYEEAIKQIEGKIKSLSGKLNLGQINSADVNSILRDFSSIQGILTNISNLSSHITLDNIKMPQNILDDIQTFENNIKAAENAVKNFGKKTVKNLTISQDAKDNLDKILGGNTDGMTAAAAKKSLEDKLKTSKESYASEVAELKQLKQASEEAAAAKKKLITENAVTNENKDTSGKLKSLNINKKLIDDFTSGTIGDFRSKLAEHLTNGKNSQADNEMLLSLCGFSSETISQVISKINEGAKAVEKELKAVTPRMQASSVATTANTNYEEQAENILRSIDPSLLTNVDKTEADANKAYSDKANEVANLKGQIQSIGSVLKTIIAEKNKLADEVQTLKEQLDAYKQTAGTPVVNEAKGKVDAAASNLNAEVSKGLAAQKTAMESLDRQSGLDNLQNNIKNISNRFLGFNQIVNYTRQALRSMWNDIKSLDQAMTNISVVTSMTNEQLWGQIDSYMKTAQQYGVTTQGVYEVAQLYYQQGLSTSEVNDLTGETLKMARIAGMGYQDAADGMTVALRAFNMEMSEAARVTDVYSKVASISASSSQELIEAMSKTASGAANVGASFESTTAMIATMVEATRESAVNIGSALKSIISRYGEMKAGSATDEEGEAIDYNKVDTALQSVGISIKDEARQFRDFDAVIEELAAKWDTLDSISQRYIATIMAGNRQQSRFIALVSNYDRYMEINDAAENAEDAGLVQYAKTLDSLESKLNQVKTSFQQFYMTIANGQVFGGIIDAVNSLLKGLNQLTTFGGLTSATSIIAGVKTVINTIVALVSQGIQKIKALINGESIGFGEGKGFLGGIFKKVKPKDASDAFVNEYINTHSGANEQDAQNAYVAQQSAINKKKRQYAIGQAAQIGGALLTSAGLNRAGQGGGNNVAWGTGISAVGNTLSMAGMGASIGGWAGAALGLLTGIATNLKSVVEARDSVNMAKADLAKAEENQEKANIERAEAKTTYNELKSGLDKIDSTAAHRFDSEETYQEWVAANTALTEKYPELISYYDEEGNAIADTTAALDLLADAAIKAAEKNRDAAKSALITEANRVKVAEATQSKVDNNIADSLITLWDIEGQSESDRKKVTDKLTQSYGGQEGNLKDFYFSISDEQSAFKLIGDLKGNSKYDYKTFIRDLEAIDTKDADNWSAVEQLIYAIAADAFDFADGAGIKKENVENYLNAKEIKETSPNKMEHLARNAANSNVNALLLNSDYDDEYEQVAQWQNIVRALAQQNGQTLAEIGNLTSVDELSDFVTQYTKVYDVLGSKNKEIMSTLMDNLDNYNKDTFEKELTETLHVKKDSELYNAYMQLWDEQQQDTTIRIINALGHTVNDTNGVLDKHTYTQKLREGKYADWYTKMEDMADGTEEEQKLKAEEQAKIEESILKDYQDAANKFIENVLGENSLTSSVLKLNSKQQSEATAIITSLNEVAEKTGGKVQKESIKARKSTFQQMIGVFEEGGIDSAEQEVLNAFISFMDEGTSESYQALIKVANDVGVDLSQFGELETGIYENLSTRLATLSDGIDDTLKNLKADLDRTSKGFTLEEADSLFKKIQRVDSSVTFSEIFKLDELGNLVASSDKILQAYSEQQIKKFQQAEKDLKQFHITQDSDGNLHRQKRAGSSVKSSISAAQAYIKTIDNRADESLLHKQVYDNIQDLGTLQQNILQSEASDDSIIGTLTEVYQDYFGLTSAQAEEYAKWMHGKSKEKDLSFEISDTWAAMEAFYQEMHERLGVTEQYFYSQIGRSKVTSAFQDYKTTNTSIGRHQAELALGKEFTLDTLMENVTSLLSDEDLFKYGQGEKFDVASYIKDTYGIAANRLFDQYGNLNDAILEEIITTSSDDVLKTAAINRQEEIDESLTGILEKGGKNLTNAEREFLIEYFKDAEWDKIFTKTAEGINLNDAHIDELTSNSKFNKIYKEYNIALATSLNDTISGLYSGILDPSKINLSTVSQLYSDLGKSSQYDAKIWNDAIQEAKEGKLQYLTNLINSLRADTNAILTQYGISTSESDEAEFKFYLGAIGKENLENRKYVAARALAMSGGKATEEQLTEYATVFGKSFKDIQDSLGAAYNKELDVWEWDTSKATDLEDFEGLAELYAEQLQKTTLERAKAAIEDGKFTPEELTNIFDDEIISDLYNKELIAYNDVLKGWTFKADEASISDIAEILNISTDAVAEILRRTAEAQITSINEAITQGTQGFKTKTEAYDNWEIIKSALEGLPEDAVLYIQNEISGLYEYSAAVRKELSAKEGENYTNPEAAKAIYEAEQSIISNLSTGTLLDAEGLNTARQALSSLGIAKEDWEGYLKDGAISINELSGLLLKSGQFNFTDGTTLAAALESYGFALADFFSSAVDSPAQILNELGRNLADLDVRDYDAYIQAQESYANDIAGLFTGKGMAQAGYKLNTLLGTQDKQGNITPAGYTFLQNADGLMIARNQYFDALVALQQADTYTFEQVVSELAATPELLGINDLQDTYQAIEDIETEIAKLQKDSGKILNDDEAKRLANLKTELAIYQQIARTKTFSANSEDWNITTDRATGSTKNSRTFYKSMGDMYRQLGKGKADPENFANMVEWFKDFDENSFTELAELSGGKFSNWDEFQTLIDTALFNGKELSAEDLGIAIEQLQAWLAEFGQKAESLARQDVEDAREYTEAAKRVKAFERDNNVSDIEYTNALIANYGKVNGKGLTVSIDGKEFDLSALGAWGEAVKAYSKKEEYTDKDEQQFAQFLSAYLTSSQFVTDSENGQQVISADEKLRGTTANQIADVGTTITTTGEQIAGKLDSIDNKLGSLVENKNDNNLTLQKKQYNELNLEEKSVIGAFEKAGIYSAETTSEINFKQINALISELGGKSEARKYANKLEADSYEQQFILNALNGTFKSWAESWDEKVNNKGLNLGENNVNENDIEKLKEQLQELQTLYNNLTSIKLVGQIDNENVDAISEFVEDIGKIKETSEGKYTLSLEIPSDTKERANLIGLLNEKIQEAKNLPEKCEYKVDLIGTLQTYLDFLTSLSDGESSPKTVTIDADGNIIATLEDINNLNDGKLISVTIDTDGNINTTIKNINNLNNDGPISVTIDNNGNVTATIEDINNLNDKGPISITINDNGDAEDVINDIEGIDDDKYDITIEAKGNAEDVINDIEGINGNEYDVIVNIHKQIVDDNTTPVETEKNKTSTPPEQPLIPNKKENGAQTTQANERQLQELEKRGTAYGKMMQEAWARGENVNGTNLTKPETKVETEPETRARAGREALALLEETVIAGSHSIDSEAVKLYESIIVPLYNWSQQGSFPGSEQTIKDIEEKYNAFIEQTPLDFFTNGVSNDSIWHSRQNSNQFEQLALLLEGWNFNTSRIMAHNATTNIEQYARDNYSVEIGSIEGIEADNEQVIQLQDEIDKLNGMTADPTINVNSQEVQNQLLNIDNLITQIAEKHPQVQFSFVGNADFPTEGGNQATGNVALAGGTLMGELGPELVVSHGRYFTVGNNGPEMVNLADDAIVFNHLQTEQLLKRGKTSSHGRPITNEQNAVGLAAGNALADPTGFNNVLLNALKEKKGGITKNGDVKMRDLGDLEKWYNLTKMIADLEQRINVLVKERETITSGSEYAKSLREQNSLLQAQKIYYEELQNARQKELEAKRKDIMDNSYLAELVGFQSNGLLQYRNGNEYDRGEGSLKDLLDFTKKNAQEQDNYLKSIGFTAKNKEGKAMKDDELAAEFIKQIVDPITKYAEDYDAVQGINDNLASIDSSIKDIEQEFIDNQRELEQEIYDVIVESTEKQIDELEEQKDLQKEANDNYINGLNDSLQKERDMYDRNQSTADREALQRQLTLLRRSGGSASEIADLESQLDEKLKDEYFNHQQEAIDNIQEAADEQVRLLETQIQLQKDALDYQKENGVIWNQVYEVMAGTEAEIVDFLHGNSTEMLSKSAEQVKEQLDENWAKQAGIWVENRAWQNDYETGKATFNYTDLAEDDSLRQYMIGIDKNKNLSDPEKAERKNAVMNLYASRYADNIANGKTSEEARAQAITDVKNQLISSEANSASKTANSSASASNPKGSSQKVTTYKEYQSDDTYHWKKSDKSDKAKHKWVTQALSTNNPYDLCTVCGRKKYPEPIKNITANNSSNSLFKSQTEAADYYDDHKASIGNMTMAEWLRKNGFATGGETGEQEGLAYLHKKERVLNAAQTKSFDALVDSLTTDSPLLRLIRNYTSSMSANAANFGTNNVQDNSINIAKDAIQIHVDSLNDKYDINDVANEIMDTMYSMAAKAGTRSVSRR